MRRWSPADFTAQMTQSYKSPVAKTHFQDDRMSRLDFSEKRDFIRMAMDAEVTLSALGGKHTGICRDLSSNGMQVETRCHVPVGEMLEVLVPSRHPELADLNALCEVIRADQSQQPGQWLLGLRIREMDGIKIA
ncbi:PilZ domain-containing protein [Pseudomonas sp. URIL14HWK12:I12]|nr:PilZ domain-containing protein [Pseudomonas sp. URIL14HWK12:I12]PVZ38369.1 PilZ domain-containing protein [Pseudomonas sp. URIL14HWK12:I11]